MPSTTTTKLAMIFLSLFLLLSILSSQCVSGKTVEPPSFPKKLHISYLKFATMYEVKELRRKYREIRFWRKDKWILVQDAIYIYDVQDKKFVGNYLMPGISNIFSRGKKMLLVYYGKVKLIFYNRLNCAKGDANKPLYLRTELETGIDPFILTDRLMLPCREKVSDNFIAFFGINNNKIQKESRIDLYKRILNKDIYSSINTIRLSPDKKLLFIGLSIYTKPDNGSGKFQYNSKIFIIDLEQLIITDEVDVKKRRITNIFFNENIVYYLDRLSGTIGTIDMENSKFQEKILLGGKGDYIYKAGNEYIFLNNKDNTAIFFNLKQGIQAKIQLFVEPANSVYNEKDGIICIWDSKGEKICLFSVSDRQVTHIEPPQENLKVQFCSWL